MIARTTSRYRRVIPTALFETLEPRTLLSASMWHVAAPAYMHASEHAAFHRGKFADITPITDLTGNSLTFSQIVGLPLRNSAVPAVQDIATITSSVLPPNLRGYSVSVDWGDGTAATRGRLVVDKAGLIHVRGFHIYKTAGTFSVTITVTQTLPRPTDGAAAPTLTIVSTANVTQNSPTGVTITPTAGAAFSGSVGTFTIPSTDTTTDPTTFSAFIRWGDGSHSMGTVALNPDGSYTVTGTHTYAAAGPFRISVFVIQPPPPTTTPTPPWDHDFDEGETAPTFTTMIFSTANVAAAPTG
jgi:hypothetical protein